MSRRASLVASLVAVLAALCWLLGERGRGGDGVRSDASTPGSSGSGERRPGLFGRPREELRGEGSLAGRLVRFADQQPVAGAVVHVTGTDHAGTAVAAQAPTDAGGSFLFAKLPAGDGYVLRVEAHGETPFTRPDLSVRARASLDVETLYLGSLAALAGRVVDEGGRPVVGADVRAYTGYESYLDLVGGFFDWVTTLDREPTPLARGRSDAEGRFLLDGLAPGLLFVRASVAGTRVGIARTRMTPEGPAGGPVVVTIEPGTVVAGVVVDDAGRPVPKASLAFLGDGGIDPTPVLFGRGLVQTDEKGAFRAFVDEGEFDVRALVAADGLPRTFTAALSAGREDVRVVLRAGVEVEVTVLEKGTRAPIPGAQVMLVASDSGRLLLSDPDVRDAGGIFLAVTDARGVASLRCRPGFLEMVTVSPPGRPTLTVSTSTSLVGASSREAGTGSDGPLEPELSARKPSRLRFHVGRGVTLVGRVLDGQGAGIPNVEVREIDPESWLAEATTRSGADGAYRLEGVGLIDGSVLVVAKAPGWVAKGPSSPGIKLPSGAAGEVQHDFTLEAASTVRGRVVDAEGKGIAGAEVRFVAEGRFEIGGGFLFETVLFGRHRAVTGADGTYVLFDVAAGRVPALPANRAYAEGDDGTAASGDLEPASGPRVTAWREGFVSGGSAAFDVPAAANVEAPPIRLSRGAVLRGHVTAPDGKPVVGATVRAEFRGTWSFADPSGAEALAPSYTLHTGPDGAFEVAAVPLGEATFTASAAGWASSRATVRVEAEIGAEPVEIRMRAARDVHGRVLGPDGRGVEGASVSATGGLAGASGDAAYAKSAFARTDADGAFLLKGLPIGTLDLRVTAAAFRTEIATASSRGGAVAVRLTRRDPAELMRLREVERELGEVCQRLAGALETAESEALRRRAEMLELEKLKLELGSGPPASIGDMAPAVPPPEDEPPPVPEEGPQDGMR